MLVNVLWVFASSGVAFSKKDKNTHVSDKFINYFREPQQFSNISFIKSFKKLNPYGL